MRASVLPEDPGYLPPEETRMLSVSLDGKSVEAVTADEEEGFVIVYKLDENGRVHRDKKTGDIALETLRGKVTITRSAEGQ